MTNEIKIEKLRKYHLFGSIKTEHLNPLCVSCEGDKQNDLTKTKPKQNKTKMNKINGWMHKCGPRSILLDVACC